MGGPGYGAGAGGGPGMGGMGGGGFDPNMVPPPFAAQSYGQVQTMLQNPMVQQMMQNLASWHHTHVYAQGSLLVRELQQGSCQ